MLSSTPLRLTQLLIDNYRLLGSVCQSERSRRPILTIAKLIKCVFIRFRMKTIKAQTYSYFKGKFMHTKGQPTIGLAFCKIVLIINLYS